jgi:hypothetical protein
VQKDDEKFKMYKEITEGLVKQNMGSLKGRRAG